MSLSMKCRLYHDNNLQRDEMKDVSPFTHMLAGRKSTLTSGQRFYGQVL